jgi:hypothetical protein
MVTKFDYTEFINMAREMIAEYGRLLTFQQLSNLPNDVNKPWLGNNQTILNSYEAYGVFVNVMFPNMIDSELLKRTNKTIIVPSLDNAILSECNIIIDNDTTWSILWHNEIKPRNEIIMYEFGVRR